MLDFLFSENFAFLSLDIYEYAVFSSANILKGSKIIEMKFFCSLKILVLGSVKRKFIIERLEQSIIKRWKSKSCTASATGTSKIIILQYSFFFVYNSFIISHMTQLINISLSGKVIHILLVRVHISVSIRWNGMQNLFLKTKTKNYSNKLMHIWCIIHVKNSNLWEFFFSFTYYCWCVSELAKTSYAM